MFVSVSRIFQKNITLIQTKFGGQVGCVTRMDRFDFEEDPDPDLRIFRSDFSPLSDRAKNDMYSMISQKVMGGFG